MENGKVFFSHSVTPERAEFLAKMLTVPLCSDCGREQDACDADPCAMKQHAHDAYVETETTLFEVKVIETINYTAWVLATNKEQAHEAVNTMDQDDWEPMKDSCEFEEYGYEINHRTWDITPAEPSAVVMMKEKNLAVAAEDWVDD